MNIDNAKYLDKIEKIQKRYPYQQMPEHLKQAFEQDMRIRLSWNTNSLEGNTLSLEETVEIISYDEVRSGHTYSEYTEAKNSYKVSPDGNGRTGRFMMNQMLLNQGILPAIILNHSKYRQAFRIYERNGGTGLMEYCLVSGIARSYEILEDNCVKLGIFPVFR